MIFILVTRTSKLSLCSPERQQGTMTPLLPSMKLYITEVNIYGEKQLVGQLSSVESAVPSAGSGYLFGGFVLRVYYVPGLTLSSLCTFLS